MRVYVGFDDTDTAEAERGTGKLARWFARELPAGCTLWGVVRHQLLIHDAIPYTSHNSSACAILECSAEISLDVITARAVEHIKRNFIEGSDPGLCIVKENDPILPALISFSLECSRRIVTQREALAAADGCLLGLGGTNDGIIGAAAAVGLSAYGWSGRFIEFGNLRAFPAEVSVDALNKGGIKVVSIDRDAPVLTPAELVDTGGWLRPKLWAGQAVVSATWDVSGKWLSLGRKRPK